MDNSLVGQLSKEELEKAIDEVELLTPLESRFIYQNNREDELTAIQLLRYKLTFRQYFAQLITETAQNGYNRVHILLTKEGCYFPEVEGNFECSILQNAFLAYDKIQRDLVYWLRDAGYLVTHTMKEFIVEW